MSDTFTVVRTVAASPELIWRAWTTPEHFAVWFGTDAVEIPLDTLDMDVRPGGTLALVMKLPDGNTIEWLGEYTEVVPPTRLAFTLSDDPGQYAGVPIVAEFTAVEGGTRLSITQDRGDFDDAQVAATIAGYDSFIDSLEVLLQDLRP